MYINYIKFMHSNEYELVIVREILITIPNYSWASAPAEWGNDYSL